MEIRNNNDFDDFDPTPRLKSSPVPILFIPFNNNEIKCNYCGNEYSRTSRIDKNIAKIVYFGTLNI